jgi:hypothetical protein
MARVKTRRDSRIIRRTSFQITLGNWHCEPEDLVTLFSGGRAVIPLRPIIKLLLAILEDGIRCYLRGPGGNRSHSFREAKFWLLEDNRKHPFSFDNICAVLGLDSQAIRRSVEHLGSTGVKLPRSYRRVS